MVREAKSEEEFDDFKRGLLEAVNSLKYGDDIHLVLVASKGHREPHIRMGSTCEGWLLKTAVDLIEQATGAEPFIAAVKRKQDDRFGSPDEALNQIKEILKKDTDERSE